MKNKIHKIIGVALTVVLLVSLVVAAAPVAAKTYDNDEWEKYEIPKEGKAGDFVLYPGSDVGPIAIDSEGILFAAAGDELFSSTDGGHRWELLWDTDDGNDIVDIAISPADDDVIYVATEATVYKSTNGGDRFSAKSTNYTGDINALDVTYFNDAYIIVIATTEDVFTFDEGQTFVDWSDRKVGIDTDDYFKVKYGATDVNVLDVRFSPNFEDDRQIVAVVWFENTTPDPDVSGVIVTTRVRGGAWGGTVGDSDFDTSTGAIDPIPVDAVTASLVFPADYDSDPDEGDYVQFLGLGDGAGDGGVFLIEGVETPDPSVVTELASAATLATTVFDVRSLAILGDASSASMLAGMDSNTQVWRSDDGGLSWDEAVKMPTGEGRTFVLLSAEEAYAATSGNESAFSISHDEGETFNQSGLIDTTLTTILGFDPYAVDTVVMLTADGAGDTSLWLTTDGGDGWERILAQGITMTLSATKKPVVGKISKIDYDADMFWVLADFVGSGTVAVPQTVAAQLWKSDDGGVFTNLRSPTPARAQTFKVIDEDTIWAAKRNTAGGQDAVLWKTTNGGVSWGKEIDTGLNSISPPGIVLIMPLRGEPETLVVGGTTDDIALTEDDGDTWEPVNPDEALEGCSASFGSGFRNTTSPEFNTIYASGAPGLFRYVIDESTEWEEYVTGYAGTVVKAKVLPPQAAPDPDATLYATLDDGTLLRAVYPTDRGEFADTTNATDYENDNAVEYEVVEGSGDAELEFVVNQGQTQIFTVDSGAGVLLTYTDTLNTPTKLTAPTDGAASGRQSSATVSWDDRDGADGYEIMWDEDPSFKIDPKSSTPEVPNYRITGLESGKTYYWRVRVAEGSPVWSPWSEKWSFTTAIGAAQWNPFTGGIPEAPYNGATNVPLQPSFAWNPADWATGYEFVLARDNTFTDAVISKTGANALPTTVYLSEQTLEYSTTYYWKVRAVSKTTNSEWATAVFTTLAKAPPPPTPPSPTPTPEPPGTPAYIWVIIGIGGALVIAVIILIVRTRRGPS